MMHPEHDTTSRERHLARALEHAHELAESRTQSEYTPAWSAQAAHVGDLTVLALARSIRD
jgi:hypothetical protein